MKFVWNAPPEIYILNILIVSKGANHIPRGRDFTQNISQSFKPLAPVVH